MVSSGSFEKICLKDNDEVEIKRLCARETENIEFHLYKSTSKRGKPGDNAIPEADVYLQRCDSINLEWNRLVSIFLRALEFYRGVISFTTNIPGNFDEAILDRT